VPVSADKLLSLARARERVGERRRRRSSSGVGSVSLPHNLLSPTICWTWGSLFSSNYVRRQSRPAQPGGGACCRPRKMPSSDVGARARGAAAPPAWPCLVSRVSCVGHLSNTRGHLHKPARVEGCVLAAEGGRPKGIRREGRGREGAGSALRCAFWRAGARVTEPNGAVYLL